MATSWAWARVLMPCANTCASMGDEGVGGRWRWRGVSEAGQEEEQSQRPGSAVRMHASCGVGMGGAAGGALGEEGRAGDRPRQGMRQTTPPRPLHQRQSQLNRRMHWKAAELPERAWPPIDVLTNCCTRGQPQRLCRRAWDAIKAGTRQPEPEAVNHAGWPHPGPKC